MQTELTPAKYTYESLDMRHWPLAEGTITRAYRKVFEGRLPQKFLIGIFTQDQFSGSRATSPFVTPDTKLKRIEIKINGIIVRELEMDSENKLFMEAYKQFVDWTGGTGIYNISYLGYSTGSRYLAFDLKENCSECQEEMLQQGYIDIHLQFAEALKNDYVMCIYNISPDTVEISHKKAARHFKAIV